MIIFNKKSFVLGVIIQIITIIIVLMPRLWFDLTSALLYGFVFIILIITGFFYLIGGYQDNENIMFIGIFLLMGAVFALIGLNFWGEQYWFLKFSQDTMLLIQLVREYIELGWSFEDYILPLLIVLSTIPNSALNYRGILIAHISLGIIVIILGVMSYLFSRKEIT